MFCKWCGNSVQAIDKRCPSCGRETTAMSDCGGFYNLKHSNNVIPQPSPAPAPYAEPVKPVVVKCPIMEKLEPKYVKDRKAEKTHHKVTIVCFFTLMLALILSVTLMLGMRRQIKELKTEISGINVAIASVIIEQESETVESSDDINQEFPEPQNPLVDDTLEIKDNQE